MSLAALIRFGEHLDRREQKRLRGVAKARARYARDPKHCMDILNRSHLANPERYLWKLSKGRAKRSGVEFSIEVDDVVIPALCPWLGIVLELGIGKGRSDRSPSLDRIDNTRGYVRGNVEVISWRANLLKRDATLVELLKIGRRAAALLEE